MIVAAPVALGVNVTEQVAATSAHDVALNEPAAPVEVKLTEPVGVIAVPGEVSVTVAVHVDAWAIGTDDGAHATAVLVVRTVTLMVPLPLLVACIESPP